MSLWIVSPAFDLSCIIAPAIASALLVVFCGSWFDAHAAVSPAFWIALVLCVDVAHVYSTLFRTYFDRSEFEQRRTLYLLAPLAAWVGGIVLYSQGAAVFWRAAAYLAVFHFVRQQYGFMMIYASREGRRKKLLLDRAAIYLATVYPLVFWHTHPRRFSWFVDHDFLMFDSPFASTITGCLLLVVLLLYTIQEITRFARGEAVSAGKNLLLLGTALSWYVGIVLFDGDLAFTLINVVSHGIPYMALVWIYQRKKQLAPPSGFVESILRPSSVWFYGVLVLVFAYLEEGLWDGLVWREHKEIFGAFQALPHVDGTLLMLVVPLLTVPQLTHYILDGFIWKVRKPDKALREFVAPVDLPHSSFVKPDRVAVVRAERRKSSSELPADA